MASSSNDRESPSPQKNSEPKADNPFIQFRQFADAQIGLLLQGIIGLPSALSKRQSENLRWTDTDDGLRRRDEFQARQRQLRQSENRRQGSETETGITSARSEEWNNSSTWDSPGFCDQNNVEGTPSNDLPLYSPVTKSLFAHLRHGDEDDTEWKKFDSQLEHWDVLSKFSSVVQILQLLFDTSGNPLKRTQNIIYESINMASDFRSDHSLLPYLLFSSYSPLALGQSSSDKFPYKDAFEDLLQTSQETETVVKCQNDYPTQRLLLETERKKGLIEQRMKNSMEDYHSLTAGEDLSIGGDYCILLRYPETYDQTRMMVSHTQREDDSTGKIVADLLWMKKLHQIGLLQPGHVNHEFGALSNAHYSPTNKSIGSELEMYDHFLKRTSSPVTITEALRAREAFLSLAKNNEEGSLNVQGQNDASPNASFGIMREILEAVRKFPVIPEASERAEETQSQPEHLLAKAAESSDRIVATRTTSMRTLNEDGSIETSTTVWKRFSSGRESSTTTRQCEDIASSENTSQRPEYEDSHLDVKNEKAGRKSGWFWN
ncbi:hypothetical protein QTJ16_006848 [Diplocarpon rosae]|uniref:Uncharacterized protein n=1 Tax=Diplocarpon rosae TaxID=946125 RepID=A0AAD9SUF6_9HELO|nr:hypothetical protein QTJ16_006848 [Diplocarpon rosae]PBP26778.1 hypothetical protein BUE80_DR002304 [Diplocarpon rosae]